MQGNGTIDKPFKISPSQLGAFSDCTCCYWLSHNGVKRPQGIMAGLPIGIDSTFRRYYRGHADAGTVPIEISSEKVQNFKLFLRISKLDSFLFFLY